MSRRGIPNPKCREMQSEVEEMNSASIGTKSGSSCATNSEQSNPSTTNSFALTELRIRLKDHASKCDEVARNFLEKFIFQNQDQVEETRIAVEKSYEYMDLVKDAHLKLSSSPSSNIPSLIQLLNHFDTSHSDALAFVFQQLKDELNNKIQIMDDSALSTLLRETVAFLSFKELRSIPLTILRKLSRIPPYYLRLLVEKNMIHEFSWPIRRQAWENNNDLFLRSIEDVCASFIHNESLRSESFKQLYEKIGPSEILFRSFASYCVTCYLKDRSNLWARLLTSMVIHLNESGQQIRSLTKLHELASMIDRCRRQGKIDVVALKFIRETIKGLILAQATYEEKLHKRNVEKYFESHPEIVRSQQATTMTSPQTLALAGSILSERKVLMGGWRFLSEKDSLKLFAHPVTEQIAPRYFEIIKQPMDLSTIKKKIEKDKYKSVVDLNLDVELMFENCKTYNGINSDLGKYAAKLLKLWQEKFANLCKEQAKKAKEKETENGNKGLSNEVTKSSNLQKGRKAQSLSHDSEEEEEFEGKKPSAAAAAGEKANISSEKLLQTLQEAFSFVSDLDTSGIFLEKVTDRIAPNYSSIIKTPMYLNLIKQKIKSHSYPNLTAFHRDVKLMLENCINYNGPGSYFGMYAAGVMKAWEKYYQEKSVGLSQTADRPSPTKPEPIDKESKPTSSVSNSSSSKAGSTAQKIGPALWEEWQLVSALDSLDAFSSEVEVNGYRDIIRHPMDLGTMKRKLSAGKYTNIDDFHRDILLIFDNCIEFNGKDADYGQYSILLKKQWASTKDYFLKKVAHLEQEANAQHRLLPSLEAKHLKSLRIWTSEERKAIDGLLSMDTPDAKRGANLATLQKMLKVAVDFLMVCDANQYFFAVPDDFIAPGYSKVILQPMSTNICQSKIAKNQYKSIDQLHDDVLLIMRNCFTYNGVDSPYTKAVVAMGVKWCLYFILLRAKVPYLSQRKYSLPIADSEEGSGDLGAANVVGGKRKSLHSDDFPSDSKGAKRAKPSAGDEENENQVSVQSDETAAKSSEGPLASEYRDQVDGLLRDAERGFYSPALLQTTSSSPQAEEEDGEVKMEIAQEPRETFNVAEKIQLSSFLSYSEVVNVWNNQSQKRLQNLFTFLVRYLSRVDDSKSFSRPMQQQIQNSKLISSLMDLTTMKIKNDRNSYQSFNSFCDDVQLMVRNCLLQFAHEQKNPPKKSPAITVDTREAAKTAQKIYYFWSLASRNIEAVLTNDPSKAVDSFPETSKVPTHTASDKDEQVKGREQSLSKESEPALDSSTKGEESVKPVDEVKEKLSSLPRPETADEKEEVPTDSKESKSKDPQPQESVLLKSSLQARKELQAQGASLALSEVDSSANPAAALCELPSVLTTSAFTWTMLMLIDPQLQSYFTRFLAIVMIRQVKDKISLAHQFSDPSSTVNIAQDKMFRFLVQMCQLTMMNTLDLPPADDLLLRFYLPALLTHVLSASAGSEGGGQSTSGSVPPEDKVFVEELLHRFPPSESPAARSFPSEVPTTRLEEASLRPFLEKFAFNLRAVKSKLFSPAANSATANFAAK